MKTFYWWNMDDDYLGHAIWFGDPEYWVAVIKEERYDPESEWKIVKRTPEDFDPENMTIEDDKLLPSWLHPVPVVTP